MSPAQNSRLLSTCRRHARHCRQHSPNSAQCGARPHAARQAEQSERQPGGGTQAAQRHQQPGRGQSGLRSVMLHAAALPARLLQSDRLSAACSERCWSQRRCRRAFANADPVRWCCPNARVIMCVPMPGSSWVCQCVDMSQRQGDHVCFNSRASAGSREWQSARGQPHGRRTRGLQPGGRGVSQEEPAGHLLRCIFTSTVG